MEIAEFWELIEDGKQRDPEPDRIADYLVLRLQSMDSQAILGFEQCRYELMDRSYRADLWNIAYIVLGGCSDDWFDYLCSWLICQGREVYESVLDRPEKLADLDSRTASLSCQSLGGVARRAYQEKTGLDDLPSIPGITPRQLKGELMDEHGLQKRYPDLWRRYIEED